MAEKKETQDIGFSSSFIQEMNNDRIAVKKGTKASFIGEITSYFLYGTEAVRNILFYTYIFSANNSTEGLSSIASSFIFLGITSIILSYIILRNFVSVSKILNNGILPSSDKLFLTIVTLYYVYTHAFLNLFFFIKFSIQSTG